AAPQAALVLRVLPEVVVVVADLLDAGDLGVGVEDRAQVRLELAELRGGGELGFGLGVAGADPVKGLFALDLFQPQVGIVHGGCRPGRRRPPLQGCRRQGRRPCSPAKASTWVLRCDAVQTPEASTRPPPQGVSDVMRRGACGGVRRPGCGAWPRLTQPALYAVRRCGRVPRPGPARDPAGLPGAGKPMPPVACPAARAAASQPPRVPALQAPKGPAWRRWRRHSAWRPRRDGPKAWRNGSWRGSEVVEPQGRRWRS